MTGPARSEHPRASSWRPRGGPDPSAGGFRHDIQGLRAIAVVLVLAFHLWPDSVTGGYVGVDSFFVISGFLITAHLLEHPPRRARDLLEFWGRRIRRLLPAAFLVLAATAIASRIVAPDTRWAATAGEIVASALYVQNWVLAGNSVDYLAAAEPPTPAQHYWSLSVEEQFYLLWPILILALFWFVSRSHLGSRLVTRVAMLAVVVGSLLISITSTATEPASAYFITPTRVWELAAGGLVATLPPLGAWRLPVRVVDGVAWLGLAMLALAGVLFTTETPFPGSAAILPVLGTALVILAASTGATSPTRFLRVRPVQHLGDTSYSIYLWHWPLIVFWPYVFDSISLAGALAIVGLTLGLATLSKVYVEDAFRFAPSFQPLKPTFRFAVAGMLVLTIVGGAQRFEAQMRLNQALASADGELPAPSVDDVVAPTPEPTLVPGETEDPNATLAPTEPGPTPTPGLTTCLGAASIVRGFDACPQDPAGKMVPSPLAAATDQSDAYPDGCWNYAPFGTRKTCTYGKGPIKIALVGNSHAGQWLPALQVLAKKDGWTITTFLASQCNATDAALEFYSSAKTAGCLSYGDWVISRAGGDAFDLVIWSERQSVPTDGGWDGTGPTATAGYASYLKRWSDAGTNVLVLQDTPYPGKTLASVPDCLASHPRNQPACAGTPDGWRPMDPLFAAATAAQLPGISTLGTWQFLCTDTVCPAVIGTVIAYFDKSHMTATYSRSIAPFIEPAILAALDPGSP